VISVDNFMQVWAALFGEWKAALVLVEIREAA